MTKAAAVLDGTWSWQSGGLGRRRLQHMCTQGTLLGEVVLNPRRSRLAAGLTNVADATSCPRTISRTCVTKPWNSGFPSCTASAWWRRRQKYQFARQMFGVPANRACEPKNKQLSLRIASRAICVAHTSLAVSSPTQAARRTATHLRTHTSRCRRHGTCLLTPLPAHGPARCLCVSAHPAGACPPTWP